MKNSTMIKCPRCHIQQEESPECEVCGLIFKDFAESARASGTARPKRTALFFIILVAAGALLASYWFISFRHNTGKKSTAVVDSNVSSQKGTDKDLRTTANELSGDVGIIKSITEGSTTGSIIAMVFFSVVGISYFTYGKKSQQLLLVICGIALMGYSYFVSGTIYIVLIGAGICVLPFLLGRR
jgi:hypothetical protein